MTAFQTNVWCYLWDLVDEGIDQVLDRLKGETGVTGISVATHYHRVDQLRPHASVSPRRFRSAGGAQFQPKAAYYSSTRMRPVVAEWLRRRDPLAAVAEGCVKRGLTLRGWTVCCHSSVTAERYPANAVKDVFGQTNPAWLCPSNVDVREYLRAMVEDLSASYPFETIELERPTFPTDLHSHYHEKVGFVCGAVGDWLRSVCFCESCRQTAAREGIDVPAAVSSAVGYLESLLATGEAVSVPLVEFLAREPALGAYAEWRCHQIASLVKLFKASCRCRLVVHRSGCRFWGATDFCRIAPHADALLAVFYNADVSQLAEIVNAATAEAGGIEKVELGLNACTPPCPGYETLVESMKKAADLGIRSVNVFNYGLIPLSRLQWIQRASRYASREAR